MCGGGGGHPADIMAAFVVNIIQSVLFLPIVPL